MCPPRYVRVMEEKGQRPMEAVGEEESTGERLSVRWKMADIQYHENRGTKW